jgi:hypothetical protein
VRTRILLILCSLQKTHMVMCPWVWLDEGFQQGILWRAHAHHWSPLLLVSVFPFNLIPWSSLKDHAVADTNIRRKKDERNYEILVLAYDVANVSYMLCTVQQATVACHMRGSCHVSLNRYLHGLAMDVGAHDLLNSLLVCFPPHKASLSMPHGPHFCADSLFKNLCCLLLDQKRCPISWELEVPQADVWTIISTACGWQGEKQAESRQMF